MKAIVKVGNPTRGMYAAEIDGSGEFVIFELLDSSEPEAGDVMKIRGQVLQSCICVDWLCLWLDQ